MRIDLHNHTVHSDGKYTSKELIERAVRNKVDIFALTDHDSVFGDDEIEKIAKDYPVKVIKGLELSTNHKGQSVHIVCLFKKNIIPEGMMKFSIEYKEKRKQRAILMMNKIHDIYGLKIDLDELLKSEVITRANMMRNIAKCNNLSIEEARKYIANDSKAYIPSTKLSVADGVRLARKNNCVVIFAHPCLVKEEYLDEILACGFDGLEAKYPSPKNDYEKMKKYAEKYHLFISAGSDCHGEGEGVVGDHGDIGTCTLDEVEFEPIKKLLEL